MTVLAAVVDAVAEVLDASDGDVVACGLDHQGESVVAWDAETGAPLSAVIVWQDQRGADVLARMSDAQLDEVAMRSGLPPDAYFSAASLGWLMTDGGLGARPGIRLGTLDAFLSDRLGAGFATDASTASRTQLSGVVGTGHRWLGPAPAGPVRGTRGGAAAHPRQRR